MPDECAACKRAGHRDWAGDLRRVGPTKPLGYLPLDALKTIGLDPHEEQERLEARGLATLLLTQRVSRVASGALYAWHRPTLAKLLEANIPALKAWSPLPDDFVIRVTATSVSREEHPDLYRLIAQAYDDPSYPFAVHLVESVGEKNEMTEEDARMWLDLLSQASDGSKPIREAFVALARKRAETGFKLSPWVANNRQLVQPARWTPEAGEWWHREVASV